MKTIKERNMESCSKVFTMWWLRRMGIDPKSFSWNAEEAFQIMRRRDLLMIVWLLAMILSFFSSAMFMMSGSMLIGAIILPIVLFSVRSLIKAILFDPG